VLCSGFNKSYGLTFSPVAIPANVSGLGHFSPLSIAPIHKPLFYAKKMKADEDSKSKSSFLASMSHEIRTPMNAKLLK
jgi:hypothetical protein